MYAEKDMNTFAGSAATALDPGPRTRANIESLHDDIHNAVGGNWDSDNSARGTFYFLDASAFDPIFWMHHAMVDRMLVMFQVLHPESWILPQTTGSTWTISDSEMVDGNTCG